MYIVVLELDANPDAIRPVLGADDLAEQACTTVLAGSPQMGAQRQASCAVADPPPLHHRVDHHLAANCE